MTNLGGGANLVLWSRQISVGEADLLDRERKLLGLAKVVKGPHKLWSRSENCIYWVAEKHTNLYVSHHCRTS
eukprot:COSAG01_NODE_3077_length_6628_cov_82.115638_3_plen_72_part_00